MENGQQKTEQSSIEDTDIDGNGSFQVPDGITAIRRRACMLSLKLKKILLPNSLTSIGDEAFQYSGLETITLPESVQSIGVLAFADCTALNSIAIPKNVHLISKYAFMNCYNLKTITLVEGRLTSIGHDAFNNCLSLEKICIPTGVTSIDCWAFVDCRNLKTVFLPESLIKLARGAFSDCRSLEAISIPASVQSIDDLVFDNCLSLKTVVLPGSLKSIGEGVFNNCPLTHIVINSNDEAYRQRIIALFPPNLQDKVLSNDLVIKIRQLHKECLEKIFRTPQINPLYRFFNLNSQYTTNKHHPKLPNDIFFSLNQASFFDNAYYEQIMTWLSDIKTWPATEAKFTTYKSQLIKKVEAYMEQVLKNIKQVQSDDVLQEYQRAQAAKLR
ncbi:Uncharacterised protein [Legionella busanensis]|uniref:Leucine-rich repeat domain-containing protein n=1 Tax=Legionella busanensis TaxID=190655 RepID=A0A378K8Z6_9GAMM|nr:leucine-rich repeat domain-containing protein [Legionella busanensis]STX81418.1 Uncharacterised protein [Legionella busanensis]